MSTVLRVKKDNWTMNTGKTVPIYKCEAVLVSPLSEKWFENPTTGKRSKLATIQVSTMSGKIITVTANVSEKTLNREDADFQVGRHYAANGAIGDKPNAQGQFPMFFQLSHLPYAEFATINDFDADFEDAVAEKVETVTNLKAVLPS